MLIPPWFCLHLTPGRQVGGRFVRRVVTTAPTLADTLSLTDLVSRVCEGVRACCKGEGRRRANGIIAGAGQAHDGTMGAGSGERGAPRGGAGLVLVHDLPQPAGVGVGRHALKAEGGGPVEERA